MTTRIFQNAWVRRRGVEVISALATDLREKCGTADDNALNVMTLLRKLQITDLPGKGFLTFKIYPERPLGYIAYVSYKPLQLHVEKSTFERARWGVDLHSNYILAHEIGHIILHDQLAKPFSEIDTAQNTIGSEEEQAEWQADCFADYLLLPENIISRFDSVEQITQACGVSVGLAERRFARRKNKNAFKSIYLGDFCRSCQNPSLIRRGGLLGCDHCGESWSSL